MAVDPYRSFHFAVEIAGVEAGRFVECSGIGADVEVIAYREGGAGQQVRHLPGQTQMQPVTLRFGLTQSRAMWDWMQAQLQGDLQRRAVSVIVFENDGQTEAMRWNLFDAWIAGWRAAKLDAGANEVAIESMTLVYDRVERD